jgi:hypothetical protein
MSGVGFYGRKFEIICNYVVVVVVVAAYFVSIKLIFDHIRASCGNL